MVPHYSLALQNALVCSCFFGFEMMFLVAKFEQLNACVVCVHALWIAYSNIIIPCAWWIQWKLQTKQKGGFVRKSIPKPMKEQVWRNTYGLQIEGICQICRYNSVSVFSFHCGHVIAVKHGGLTTIANLRPICAMCNLSMRTENLHSFKKRFI